MKKLIILILSFCYFSFLFSQEGLRPLNANLSFIYKSAEHAQFTQNLKIEQAKSTSNSLFLPFKDDFYYAYSNKYPNKNLWLDSNVYVNTGYPIAPPSIGVATFDGLNKHGYPYNPNLLNLTQSPWADTLTSKPINLAQTSTSQSLQPSDSIALSFYYQARGNGEAPELNDVLTLDFYMPSQKAWSNNIWTVNGNANSNTNDTIFKRAFIWIKDTAFIKDGFQFRLRNSATAAGDFDHWHVDYVYLDKNRSQLGDTVYNDLTFANVGTHLLKDYWAMPFQQYNSSEMSDKISIRIKNNSAAYINHSYDLKILNANNQQLHLYAGGPINLCPFKRSGISACTGTTGYSTYQAHANPTFNYSFAPLTDSTDFIIKHSLSLTGSSIDFFKENDTIIQYQKFRNYYALDDGSAEVGYYVNAIGGKMAMKFKLNVFDTLQAVRIYFDPVGNVPLATTGYSFNIMLWQDGGNGPGNEIFKDVAMLPIYHNTGYKEFPEYKLTVTDGLRKLGPGNYYIGFQQKVATGIAVGFDKNTNHSNMLYYDAGNGWTQSSIPGSIMINPVFGKRVPSPVGVSENTKNNLIFNVYPIPSSNLIYLKTEIASDYQYQIMDALGRNILEDTFTDNATSINIENIPNGIYFLNLFQTGKTIHQQKIIVQH